MNIRNLAIRLAIGLGALGVGGVMATSPAFAASSSAPTTLSLTIPVALSMSGLAASYNNPSAVAGTTAHIVAGPVTVTTNNALGYKVIAQASTATFVGTGSNLQTIPVANDSVVVVACPTGDTCAAAAPLASATNIQILNRTTATNGDVWSVDNAIAIPGSLTPDTYSIVFNLTALTN